jgi:2-hydroxychromene-2-carboxylate isomerase
MNKATWYFDFISPFAYLQFSQFTRLQKDLDIKVVPVVFGALLKHWGQLGPAEIQPKRTFVYRFFNWQADRIGIPFNMPPSHPYNPLPSLRLCISAGSKITHVQSIFNVIYRDGVQPDSEEGIGKIAKALGISSQEIESNKKESKRILRKNTKEAISNGVFGVPTFLINKELFWGGDSLDMMLDYLDNRDLFNTPKMKRINEMPMGLTRKK